jgi:hypothetical protein
MPARFPDAGGVAGSVLLQGNNVLPTRSAPPVRGLCGRLYVILIPEGTEDPERDGSVPSA